MKPSKTKTFLLLPGITTFHHEGNKTGQRMSDKLTEADFRRWVITNFSKLKDHVLTQCKETKNLEKRFDKMLMRINSLEKNINNLMELKNTT